MEDFPIAPSPDPSTRDVEENRLAAALGWVWVLSFIVLLVKRESPFVQFHARQGTVLFLASLLLWVALGVFGRSAWVFRELLKLGTFVLITIGFVQALRGKHWALPVLGSLASALRL